MAPFTSGCGSFVLQGGLVDQIISGAFSGITAGPPDANGRRALTRSALPPPVLAPASAAGACPCLRGHSDTRSTSEPPAGLVAGR